MEKEDRGYKYKACPFRERHFCGSCELLVPKIDMCVFKCINANLGILSKTISGDKEIANKIKEELRGNKDGTTINS